MTNAASRHSFNASRRGSGCRRQWHGHCQIFCAPAIARTWWRGMESEIIGYSSEARPTTEERERRHTGSSGEISLRARCTVGTPPNCVAVHRLTRTTVIHRAHPTNRCERTVNPSSQGDSPPMASPTQPPIPSRANEAQRGKLTAHVLRGILEGRQRLPGQITH